VFLAVLLWVVLDYRTRRGYPAWLEFTATESRQFDELTVVTGNTREKFKLGKGEHGRAEYRNVNPNSRHRTLPTRPDAVIVKEGDREVVFEPDRDAKGNFKARRNEPLYYREKGGKRVMTEGYLGRIDSSRYGRLVAYALVNLVHLAAWVAALWLLLRFGWTMALAQAVVFWLVMSLFVMPAVLKQAETVADRRAVPVSAPAPE
jgi:hypothetical protein